MGSRRMKLMPEFEHELLRDPRLGYEPPDTGDFVRCIAHGSPTPLERWHCHDEYELQLIVGARGRAFVGDHVGHFEPGHLVLTGPRLPHNWVSTDLPPDGLVVRSLVIQFREEPLQIAMQAFREFDALRPLLDRARHGIEFFGLSEVASERFHRIQASHGLGRLAEFLGLLDVLRRWEDYRLLSAAPQNDSPAAADMGGPLGRAIAHIQRHHTEPLSVTDVAAAVHMSESAFSRSFSKATGISFTAFVNRLRIHKACELLMHSDTQVSRICFAVGFNNVANFNRRFLAVKGMTPREFRRQALERLGPLAAPR